MHFFLFFFLKEESSALLWGLAGSEVLAPAQFSAKSAVHVPPPFPNVIAIAGTA